MSLRLSYESLYFVNEMKKILKQNKISKETLDSVISTYMAHERLIKKQSCLNNIENVSG
jgi:hypothetical protein